MLTTTIRDWWEQNNNSWTLLIHCQEHLTWKSFVLFSILAVISVPIYYLIYYQKAIRRRVKGIEERLARGIVTRDTGSSPKKQRKVIRALELHPSLQAQGNFISLGQYLSSLRVNTSHLEDETEAPISRLLEKELEATIGSVLLQHFGPRIGAALLPMMGISKVDSWLASIAAKIASYVASHMLVNASEQWDSSEDMAAFPFSMSEMAAFINLNQKFRAFQNKSNNNNITTKSTENSSVEITPIEWMERGEIGYSPGFATIKEGAMKDVGDDVNSEEVAKELLPNPFDMDLHFELAILGMEDRIRSRDRVSATNPTPNGETVTTTQDYDPNDKSLPTPTPINERVLPDLHMGWGDAKCTHSKREILKNRLLAVLLTKLSHNYYMLENKQESNLFTVIYKGNQCQYPDKLIGGLMEDHTIEVCPRSTITTFGIAACVKEEDGSLTGIPIGFFFRTGYEREDGKPAYFSAPHGGLDLSIKSGPLVDKDSGSSLDIQFYVAIEGLCAWHSNHNVDVPWVKSVSTTDPYDKDQIIHSVRMAGLLAVTFNSLATEMDLPFGGYGILGMCNDSAAFIDFALRGETNMYPLISTGRYLFHTARRLLRLNETLLKCEGFKETSLDLLRLVRSACNLDSDIHCSPSHLLGASRRYLTNNPSSYFQLTEDSKSLMTNLSKVFEAYAESEGSSWEIGTP